MAFYILTAISTSDLYDIIFHGPLLPTEHIEPATYPAGKTRTNEGGRPSTVEDICDFIVEYVHSDVLVRFILCSVCYDLTLSPGPFVR